MAVTTGEEPDDPGETRRHSLLAKFPHVQFPSLAVEIPIKDILADGPDADLNLSEQSSPRNDLTELDLERETIDEDCRKTQGESNREKRRRAWSQAIEDHIDFTQRVNEVIYVTPREGLEGASQPDEQSPQTMLIINGRRRMAGARKAGLATILAFVLVGFKNLREAKRYAVVANLLTRQVGADHRKAGLHQLIEDEELMIATGEATHRSSHNLLGMAVGLDHEAVAKIERENWYARWLVYVKKKEKRLGQDEIPRLLRGDAWDCDKRFPNKEVCLAPFCEATSRYARDGQKFTQGLVEIVEAACLKRIGAVEAGREPKPDDWDHHLRPYLLDCLAAVKEFARQQEEADERARRDREEADKLVDAGDAVDSGGEDEVEDEEEGDEEEGDEEEQDEEDSEDEEEEGGGDEAEHDEENAEEQRSSLPTPTPPDRRQSRSKEAASLDSKQGPSAVERAAARPQGPTLSTAGPGTTPPIVSSGSTLIEPSNGDLTTGESVEIEDEELSVVDRLEEVVELLASIGTISTADETLQFAYVQDHVSRLTTASNIAI